VAVLTQPGFGPRELARALAGSGRRIVVAERLGEPDERVVEGPTEEIAAGEFADPNVVLCLDPARSVAGKGRLSAPRGPERWALPEDAFEHRAGMITKTEVRALALARLGPGLGDLVWDVGAGSGALGIECARLGAAAIAVEREGDECERARRNAAAHGVALEVVHGEAPAALADLPEPDAVFIGGAGPALPQVLELCAARARRALVVALATVERTAPTAAELERAGYAVEGVMLAASRLRELGEGHRLAAENPVFVMSGARG
jgi:precorrin-6Y C5,15-methyltransferase (decarboxylating)